MTRLQIEVIYFSVVWGDRRSEHFTSKINFMLLYFACALCYPTLFNFLADEGHVRYRNVPCIFSQWLCFINRVWSMHGKFASHISLFPEYVTWKNANPWLGTAEISFYNACQRFSIIFLSGSCERVLRWDRRNTPILVQFGILSQIVNLFLL